MNREEFNSYCKGLPQTTHVVQWGNSDVWKIGAKVFAICGWNKGADAFTFKASDMAFEVLSEQPGVRPAPYMASRGLKWLQHYAEPGLSDAELKQHIEASYHMVITGLTKKKRLEMGLG